MKTKSKRTIPWWFFSWLGLICLAAIAIPVLEYESAEAGWRYANRYLVRIGLPLFLLSFVASSLHRLKPSKLSRLLMKNRRYLGLGFAMAHFTHLFAIVVFFSVSDEAVDTLTLIGGGATYVLIALMALSLISNLSLSVSQTSTMAPAPPPVERRDLDSEMTTMVSNSRRPSIRLLITMTSVPSRFTLSRTRRISRQRELRMRSEETLLEEEKEAQERKSSLPSHLTR